MSMQKQNGTQRVDVSRLANLIACSGSLFGRHKAGSAERLAALRQATFLDHSFRQSKIGHARIPGMVDQDVGWFQVTMNDTFFMCVRYCNGNFLQQFRGFRWWQWATGNSLRQRRSFDQPME